MLNVSVSLWVSLNSFPAKVFFNSSRSLQGPSYDMETLSFLRSLVADENESMLKFAAESIWLSSCRLYDRST